MKALVDAAKAINAKRSTEGADGVRQSDGCTGVPDWNIRKCCEKHDMDYMNPATSRWEDDCNLRKCMRAKMCWWNPLPMIYFIGVRVFGASRHAAFQEYNYDDEGELIMD